MLHSYSIKLKLCIIVKYIKQVMNIPLFFLLLHIFKGKIIDVFPDFTELSCCSFMDTAQAVR